MLKGIKESKFINIAFLSLIIFGIFCLGCAHFQDYGWKGYVAATDELASLAEQYEFSYQNASKAMQAKWKADIDPLFVQADNVLKEWKAMLELNINPENSQQTYFALRKLILKYLIEIKEE